MKPAQISALAPLAGIGILAFILPLAHTPFLRNTLAVILTGAMLVLLAKRRLTTLPSVWMAPWAAICLLSAAWSINAQQSFSEALGNIFFPMGCCLAAAHWLSRERVEKWLAIPLLSGFAFVLLAHWLYLATGEIEAPAWIQRLNDFWPGRGVASTLAIFSLPLAAWLLMSGSRWVGGTLLLVAMLVGSQNWNRMFWLAALAALLPSLMIFRLPRRGRLAMLAASLGIVSLGFWYAVGGRAQENPQMPGTVQEVVAKDPRWVIWPAWAELGMQQPLLGHGVGYRTMQQLAREKLPQSLYDFSPFSFTHGHNILLDTFVQVGGLGLIIYLLLLGDLFRRFWTRLRAGEEAKAAAIGGIALIIGMLAKNMTDDFMHYSSAVLFWLMLGAFAKLAGMAGDSK